MSEYVHPYYAEVDWDHPALPAEFLVDVVTALDSLPWPAAGDEITALASAQGWTMDPERRATISFDEYPWTKVSYCDDGEPVNGIDLFPTAHASDAPDEERFADQLDDAYVGYVKTFTGVFGEPIRIRNTKQERTCAWLLPSGAAFQLKHVEVWFSRLRRLRFCGLLVGRWLRNPHEIPALTSE